MALANPGKAPRQAPRFPTIVLGALEGCVVSQESPMNWRVLSWWLLIQSWGTLRFDDHRGLLPGDFRSVGVGSVGQAHQIQSLWA